jgi:glycosyltransferase involved in cell wall biosynthesis
MKKLDLSIIIPCFDEGALLLETVTSVLQQEAEQSRKLPEFEVIIVNDHSKNEDTLAAIDQLVHADSRVRVILNAGKSGPAGGRNTGIRAAQGEWVAFLDGDDIWLKNAIDIRWRVVESVPDVEWISADYQNFHENEFNEKSWEQSAFRRRGTKAEPILRDAYDKGEPLRLVKPIAHFLEVGLAWTSVAMIKHSLLMRVGCFDESLRRVEDTHLWMRLAHEADFFFCPHVIAGYRQRPSTIANRGNSPGEWEVRAVRLLLNDARFKAYSSLLRKRAARWCQEDILYYRVRRQRLKGFMAFARSVLYGAPELSSWKNVFALLVGR